MSVEDLLITDSPNGERGSRVLGIAGVMGGMYGEVTAETKNILLESAHFDQVSIARSARRHKIPSEAPVVSNAVWTTSCSRQPPKWPPN